MSQVTTPVVPSGSPERPGSPSPSAKHVIPQRKRLLTWCIACTVLAAAIFYGVHSYRSLARDKDALVPVAKVQRGDVSLAIFARGEVRGGNPETLTAPMTGGTEMHITFLRKTGEEVKPGDVVV